MYFVEIALLTTLIVLSVLVLYLLKLERKENRQFKA